MAAPTVKISGVSYPAASASLKINHRAHARSTAGFAVIDATAANHFSMNQPVTILDLDGTTTLFAGWIDNIVETLRGTAGITHQVTCKDNHYLADKRLVGPDGTTEFVSMTSGAIVEWIIDNILTVEGVTDGTIRVGLTVDRIPADHVSCAEIIERLADLNGFVWKINNDRTLDFRPRTLVTASISPDGSDMLRGSVRVRRRNFSYRNKQYILASDQDVGVTGRTAEENRETSLAGNGSTRVFILPIYVTKMSLIEVTRDGGATWTSESFTEVFDGDPAGGFGSEKWHWSDYDNQIYQNPAETVLDGTDDFVRVIAWGYAGIQTHEMAGQPSDDTYDVPWYFRSPPYDDDPRIEVNTGTGFSRDTVGHITLSDPSPSGDWTYQDHTNFVVRQAAALAVTDTVRIKYGQSGISDIELSNSDEIARNKAIEGNTTSGIVENVITDYESTSAAESNQHALAELKRWAHETIELEFETKLSDVAAGERITVNLPLFGLNSEEFMVDAIKIRERPIATGSQLLYHVTAIQSPTAGASGGAIGRAANPRRFSDLFRQLNDRVRLPQFRREEAFTIPPTEEDDTTPDTGTPPNEMTDDGGFGPRIWLKADAITGLADSDPLSTWEDQSTFGHDFSQSTAAKKPLYKTNRVNGLPAVLADGADDQMTNSGVSQAHMRVDSTVFIVLRFTSTLSTAANAALAGIKSTNRIRYYPKLADASGGEMAFASTGTGVLESTFTPVADVWYLMVWEVADEDGEVRFWVNGTQHGSVAVTSVPDGDSDYYLFENGLGADFMKGEIAELVMYGDTMKDNGGEGREQVELYLMDKYGL